jgi:hypothetical protein
MFVLPAHAPGKTKDQVTAAMRTILPAPNPIMQLTCSAHDAACVKLEERCARVDGDRDRLKHEGSRELRVVRENVYIT